MKLLARSLLVGLVLFFFMENISYAETLPVVLVTASWLSESELSSGTVTVINPSEYQGEFKDVASLLDHVAGVHVIKLRGRGGYAVASIRGSTSSQVAVYIDGILVNLQGEPAFDLSNISLNDIKRIEIYRGHIPARFGVSGMGGVINIVTKKKASKFKLLMGGGSFGDYKISGFIPVFRAENRSCMLTFETAGSKGDFKYYNDNNTPYNKTDDYMAVRKNNSWYYKKFMINSNINNFKIKYSFLDKRRHLPLAAPGTDKANVYSSAYLDTYDWSFGVSKRYDFTEGNWGWFFEHREKVKEFFNPKNEVGWYGQLYNRYTTVKDSVGISYLKQLNHCNLLELFMDYSKETLNVTGDIVDVFGGRDKFAGESLNLTLQDTIFLTDDYTFTLTPVLRYNRFNGKDKVSGSLAVSKNLGENLTLSATYGIYYRFPNFYELYGDGATLLPNPSLKEEKSNQWDLGLKWLGSINNVSIKTSLVYFVFDSDNLIEYIMTNPRFGCYKNIGKASVKGIEFSLDALYKSWMFTLSYTYMGALNLSPGYRYKKALPNRPKHSAYVRISKNLRTDLKAFLELEYTGQNYADEAERIKYSDFLNTNLGLKYEFKNGAVLSLTVNNLFNNQDFYLEPRGKGAKRTPWYPVEGRAVFLSYSFSF